MSIGVIVVFLRILLKLYDLYVLKYGPFHLERLIYKKNYFKLAVLPPFVGFPQGVYAFFPDVLPSPPP